jgi:hypothetical protein
MSSQELGYHEMRHIFVGPIRQVAGDGCEEGYVKGLHKLALPKVLFRDNSLLPECCNPPDRLHSEL